LPVIFIRALPLAPHCISWKLSVGRSSLDISEKKSKIFNPLFISFVINFGINHRGRREATENHRGFIANPIFFSALDVSEKSNFQFSSEYWKKLHRKQNSNQDDVA
jgi:hypothetical protein